MGKARSQVSETKLSRQREGVSHPGPELLQHLQTHSSSLVPALLLDCLTVARWRHLQFATDLSSVCRLGQLLYLGVRVLPADHAQELRVLLAAVLVVGTDVDQLLELPTIAHCGHHLCSSSYRVS